MPFLIFDIETVPDPQLWSPPAAEVTLPTLDPAVQAADGRQTQIPGSEQLPGATTLVVELAEPPKKRSRTKKTDAIPKPEKDPMPPLYACRPIAIGYMLLSDAFELQYTGVVGTLTYGDDEVALLRGWSDFVQQNVATLVSFSGRTFDMPVLSMRAMRHGVSLPWYGRCKQRYKEDAHLDLCDQLTEFGAISRTGYSLSAFSTTIGLPAKTQAGSMVSGMFAAGEHQKIADYCLEDIFRTALLFLRHELMRGHITIDTYKRSAHMIVENAIGRGPAMGGLLWGLDKARLLLE